MALKEIRGEKIIILKKSSYLSELNKANIIRMNVDKMFMMFFTSSIIQWALLFIIITFRKCNILVKIH